MPGMILLHDTNTFANPAKVKVKLTLNGQIDITLLEKETLKQVAPARVLVEYNNGYILAHVHTRKPGDETCMEPETFILKGPQTREEIQKLWDGLQDIPIDPDHPEEPIEEDYFIWKKGTPREDIWQWFDQEAYKRTRPGEKLTVAQLMGVAPIPEETE